MSSSSKETQYQSFEWLVRLRWFAILSLALMVLFIEGETPQHPFAGMWAILLAASFLNLSLFFLGRLKRFTGTLILFGFLMDGFLASWGIAVTGGPVSAYTPFYMIIIMAACFLVSPWRALFVTLGQWMLYLSTLWACYRHSIPDDFAPHNSNPFSVLVESGVPEDRFRLFLDQGVRWTFFFALTFALCGLLVRQIWRREERLRGHEKSLDQKRHLIQMGEMTGRVAHGINTPLGLISGNLEILMAEVSKKGRVHQQLVQIDQYVQRAIRTVRDVLDFGRKSMSEIKRVDLHKVVQAVVLTVQPRLKKKAGNLILDLEPQLPELLAYPEGLFQVLANLLENAIDSIDKGGMVTLSARFEYRSVRLSRHDRRGQIKIVVRDTGRGIPSGELKNIFEPFYTTKGFGQGTGLGLAIVKRIVAEHQGEVKVESKVGHGTSFTVLLPTEGMSNSGLYYNEDSATLSGAEEGS